MAVSATGKEAAGATAALTGIVRTQAHMIRTVTPHRTAETRRLEPTPMIAPLITCVVETGSPRCEAARIVTAALVSAANPSIGFSSMIFVPIVLMIRTPPAIVPAPIADRAGHHDPERNVEVLAPPAIRRSRGPGSSR